MKTGRPVGRPPHVRNEVTAKRVKLLAAMGIIPSDIAKVVELSAPTVRKYYLREIETGGIEANAAVAQSLYRQATASEKPSVIAQIFYLKCRAGWREDGGEPMGKKEAQELLARMAEKGTEWDKLLHSK